MANFPLTVGPDGVSCQGQQWSISHDHPRRYFLGPRGRAADRDHQPVHYFDHQREAEMMRDLTLAIASEAVVVLGILILLVVMR